jgi:hypothetical protein
VQQVLTALQGMLSSLFGGGSAEQGAAPGGTKGKEAASDKPGSGGSSASGGVGAKGEESFGFVGFVGIWSKNDTEGGSKDGESSRDNQEPGTGQQEGWGATAVVAGKATVDLGSKYKLAIDENNSEMTLIDKQTGKETRVWGDPHIDWKNDGKTADDADFKNTLTFKLPDDTKVTIDTEPAEGHKGATFSNKVTVTKGDDAFVIDGLSQNRKGDLNIQRRTDGRALDQKTDDGYVLLERQDGQGWINEALGRRPKQADLDAAKA